MDTTYFGTRLGVMVFKDSLSGQILYKQYVKKKPISFTYPALKKSVEEGLGYSPSSVMDVKDCCSYLRVFRCRCASFIR
jgi:hypothetical protein